MKALFWLYRVAIGPAIHFLAGPGFGCRFQPTCSQYAEEAIRTHGWFRGFALGLRRLVRCRPGASFGWDPVPLARTSQKEHEHGYSCGCR